MTTLSTTPNSHNALLAVGHSSVNSPQRATFLVHFPHSFQLELLTLQLHDQLQSLLGITSNIFSCTMMVGLRDTHGSAILHSTLRCGGVLFRQAESMSTNILMMLDSLRKSCVIWLDMGRKSFQIICSTMQPAYEEHDTTGSSNRADSLPWLTRLVCPLYSLPTVQLTSNGQNCLICPDDT